MLSEQKMDYGILIQGTKTTFLAGIPMHDGFRAAYNVVKSTRIRVSTHREDSFVIPGTGSSNGTTLFPLTSSWEFKQVTVGPPFQQTGEPIGSKNADTAPSRSRAIGTENNHKWVKCT